MENLQRWKLAQGLSQVPIRTEGHGPKNVEVLEYLNLQRRLGIHNYEQIDAKVTVISSVLSTVVALIFLI